MTKRNGYMFLNEADETKKAKRCRDGQNEYHTASSPVLPGRRKLIN